MLKAMILSASNLTIVFVALSALALPRPAAAQLTACAISGEYAIAFVLWSAGDARRSTTFSRQET